MNTFLSTAAQYYRESRKAAAALAGSLGSVLALGLIPNPYAGWAAVAVSLLTGYSVFKLANDPAVLTAPASDDDTSAPLSGD